MVLMGSRVPMFKLRPYRSLLIAALFCGIVGGLLSVYFLLEDVYNEESSRGLFSLILTVVVVVIFVLAAFSRYRFAHLHHHRGGYKRG